MYGWFSELKLSQSSTKKVLIILCFPQEMSLDVNWAKSVGLGVQLILLVDGWFGRECTLTSSCNKERALTIKQRQVKRGLHF